MSNFTIAVLGSHSALDVCRGARDEGFKTLVIAEKGRDKTYAKYFKSRDPSINSGRSGSEEPSGSMRYLIISTQSAVLFTSFCVNGNHQQFDKLTTIANVS